MKTNSIDFIYRAMNAIASGKHDPETEQCLAEAIEGELLEIKASLVLPSWGGIALPTSEVEAYSA
jgi:hypothetical protein